MARNVTVTIVGPGSLGGALALALHDAAFPVREIVYGEDRRRALSVARKIGAKASHFGEAEFGAELVWLCVPDAAIAPVAKVIARKSWAGKYVFHSSGALAADELAALQKRAAAVASVHPMMSFVRGAEATFADVAFAVEGDAVAVALAAKMAKALGGSSFRISAADKPLYHTLGAFSSPMMVALFAAAEKIGRELGLSPQQTRRVTGPILRKTLDNYLELGAAESLSGPLTRGDAATVRRNLKALGRVPGAADIYRALARVAIEELPVKNRTELEKAVGVRRRAKKANA